MIITRKEKFNNKGFAAVFPTTNEQIDTEEWYVDAGAFFHHIQTAAKEHIKVENNTSVPVEQMDSLSVGRVRYFITSDDDFFQKSYFL